MSRLRPDLQGPPTMSLSQTASSPSPSSNTYPSGTPRPGSLLNCCLRNPHNKEDCLPCFHDVIVGTPLSRSNYSNAQDHRSYNLDLQLSIGSPANARPERKNATHENFPENDMNYNRNKSSGTGREKVGLLDILSMRMVKKAYGEEARRE